MNKILIVDDSRLSQAHLAQILSEEYEIITASDGGNAIDIARKELPDLILLDVIMPNIDGYAVLEALHALPETKNIPVIFITGLDQDADEEKGLSMGAADYIAKPFNPVLIRLRVKQQIKMVNQLKTIEQLTTIDGLTGLPNRRYFDRRLSEEWERAIFSKHEIGLCMLDVDGLKAYNDSHGFKSGDMCLSTISNIITNELDIPGHFAARWGGEQFAILMPGTSGADNYTFCEKIRALVENTEIESTDGEQTNITISGGIFTVNPSDSDIDKDSFVSQANASLYLAKELGGNKTILSQNE